MIAPDAPAVRFARMGRLWWHLVNRAGASLCGAPGPWQETRAAQDTGAQPRCPTCAERTWWLYADCPVPPHADRQAYSRWLQTEWWLAGGLVFPVAGSAQHAQQEGR